MLIDTETGMKIQHRLFCDLYVADPNHRQGAAYLGAYPSFAQDIDCETTRRSRASGAARVLLKREDVSLYITERIGEIHADLEITPERIKRELAAVAFFNPQEVFDDAGNPRPMHLLPNHAARALTKFKTSTTVDPNTGTLHRDFDIAAASKLDALKTLATAEGMLVTRNELTGKNGAPINVQTLNVNTDNMDVKAATDLYQQLINGGDGE